MKMDLGIAEQSRRERRYAALWFTIAGLLAITAVAICPAGYIGANADDQQYLAAARCWIEHGGMCVPNSHWWTRWPVFAPVVLFTSLFGESRFTVQLGPAIWWALALAMTGRLGTRWFGWRAGALAIALMGTAPVIAFVALDPTVDIPEFALQLSALSIAVAAYDRQAAFLAVIAGAVAGLALQARDTSLLFLGVCGLMWFTLPRDRRKVLLWAIVGLSVVELSELLAYAIATGDPLLRFRLALGHTNIHTSELPANFHATRSPLLNMDLVRSWTREVGITVWWPIDPWLNILASPQAGRLVVAAIAALALFGRRLTTAERKCAALLIGAALLIAVGLVYVLALDPKSRLFMTLYAALAVSAGAAIAKSLAGNTKMVAIALAVIPMVTGLYVMGQLKTSAEPELRARQWVHRYGSDMEVHYGAASYLTLVPEVRALAPMGSGRRYLIMTAAGTCEGLIDHQAGHRDAVLIDKVVVRGELCLFEYLPGQPNTQGR